MNASLENLIKDYNSLCIMGMCKNAGKTEVFNYLLSKASHNDIVLGITSIGRDGEELDAVTLTKKPRIFVRENTLLATSRQSLFLCDFTKEILHSTGINTPMGEIIIVRALSGGYADLAGPSTLFELSSIIEKLNELGASKIMVDGALSRKSFSSPFITEACILATGAALSSHMEKVIDETTFTVRLFSLEAIKDNQIIRVAEAHGENNVVVVINKYHEPKILKVVSSLHCSKEIIENVDSFTRYILVNGAVTDKLLLDLLSLREGLKNITLLVKDSTKLIISEDTYNKFIFLGGNIKVLKETSLLAVTINPTSPQGYEFDSHIFKEKLQEKINVPVINIFNP